MTPFKHIPVILVISCFYYTTFAQTKKPAGKTAANKTAVAKKTVTAGKATAGKPRPKPTATATKTAIKSTASNTNKKAPAKTKPATTTATKTVKPATTTTNQPISLAPVVLTPREQEMVKEINFLRAKPAEYCIHIDNYLDRYDADANVRDIATELKNILKKMKPLNQLTLSHDMYRDAKNFGLTLAKNNLLEHSDLPYAENISLGYDNIRDAIIDLLIDDDDPDRGHRRNLLSDRITAVAVAEIPGKIQDIAYCYVQEFK